MRKRRTFALALRATTRGISMTTNSIKNVIHSAMKNLFRKEIALMLLVILAAATTALGQDGLPVQPAITPVPLISQLSPVSVAPGGPDLTLTVGGANFTIDCVVQWNGSALATTFVSVLELTAVVPAALTASGGTGQITVLATDTATVVVPVRRARPASPALVTVVSNVAYFPIIAPITITDARLSTTAGTAPFGMVAADFNGDGILDLAVANNDDNTVSVLLGNGDGTFQTQTTFATVGSPYGIAVVD
jgi:hypothetical protein